MNPSTTTGRKLRADFGLEIRDLDLRDALSAYVWEGLRQALWAHSLLVVRRQALIAADLSRIARQIGDPDSAVKRFETLGPSPDQQWHAVGAITGAPALATLLCVREAPLSGGGMEFASTRSLYAALTAEERAVLDQTMALHAFRAEPARTIRHALVVEHPRSRARSLLLGYHVIGVEGPPLPAHLSPEALLERASVPERVYRHDFEPGDVLLWDNWALMHRACALAPGEKRIVEEVAIGSA